MNKRQSLSRNYYYIKVLKNHLEYSYVLRIVGPQDRRVDEDEQYAGEMERVKTVNHGESHSWMNKWMKFLVSECKIEVRSTHELHLWGSFKLTA